MVGRSHENPGRSTTSTQDDHKKRTRYTNLLKQRFKAKRTMDGAAATLAPDGPNVQMPDEYLPTNKILFLQNVPESVTQEQSRVYFLSTLTCAKYGLSRPKRTSYLWNAFDEGSATVAKDVLHTYKLDGENRIKIIFARQ